MLARLIIVLLSASGFFANAENDEWDHGAMAVTANPHATNAAMQMLSQGGHAVDAAIAAHLVLGLVEPQSSGIGGGGFLLVYGRANKSLTFHDGRETAPGAATADMFMLDDEVMPYLRAWQSGKSVGVPGVVALYKHAHERYGLLPWQSLFQPAIELAQTGFEVSPRLASFLARMAKFTRLDENPGAAEYFYPQGRPLEAGQLRKNPAYAETLQAIAKKGPIAFYSGDVAQAIVDAARAAPDPGLLAVADLENYTVKMRPSICGGFRSLEICSASPPSSGAAQIMMARLYDYLLAQSDNDDKTQAFVDAQRLAYADRDHFFADPDATAVPVEALLDAEYLKRRAAAKFEPNALPLHGDPGATEILGADTTEESKGTTHLSIVDGFGNAVSFTATVEAPFGSARWVKGFLLNNEMTDFARSHSASEASPANAVAAGKRPRSSMSPSMVFDAGGDLLLVTGSPGGNSIPAYVSKTIIGLFDWGLSPQAAVDFPNIVARGAKVRVETGVEGGANIAKSLKALGYQVQEREGENSGIHLIYVSETGLEGAADKRREGTVGVWQKTR